MTHTGQLGGLVFGGVGLLAAWMSASRPNETGATVDGIWPKIGTVDGAPLAVGACLVLGGLAFAYGERPRRDTDGLV